MRTWYVFGILCWFTVNMSPAVAFGESDSMDRTDWNQLTELEKTAYVSGFLDAMQVVRKKEGSPALEVPGSETMIPDLKDVDRVGLMDKSQMTNPEKAAYASGFRDAGRGVRMHEGLKWVGVPVSDVVEGLNSYYADPQTKKLPISLALVFLHGRVAGVERRAAQGLMNN